MPDEAQAPSSTTGENPAEPEAPESAAPPEGLPAESESTDADAPETTDYRKRFEDLQPQLTQAQQQNAEFNRLVEAARQGNTEALDALGIPYEAGEDDDEFLDPDEQLRREFEELKNEHLTAKQQAEQTRLEDQEAEYIAGQIDSLEKKAGIELDDEAVDFVIDRARSNRGQDGRPEVEAAFKGFTSVLDTHQERYLKSKNDAPKAPVGGPGEEKFDPANDDERLKALSRAFEAEEGSD
jgi:hypothetical protein